MFKDLTKVKIQNGIFTEVKNASGFSILYIFKRVLKYLNIAYVDVCCDNNDVTNLPMRFNSTDETSQYFDSVTNTWVDAPNGGATQDLFLSSIDFDGDGLTALTEITIKKPYLVYIALLTQIGTGAPIATVLENTLGGTPIWQYNGTELYSMVLNGAFTANKTTVLLGNQTYEDGKWLASTLSINSVDVKTISEVSPANGYLSNTMIEIRVYP